MLNENMIYNSISNNQSSTTLNNKKMSNDQLINNQLLNEKHDESIDNEMHKESINETIQSNQLNNISVQFDNETSLTNIDKIIFNDLPQNNPYSSNISCSNIELAEPNIKILEPDIQLTEPTIEFEEIDFLENNKSDDNIESNYDNQSNLENNLLDNNNNQQSKIQNSQINNLNKNEQESNLQNNQNNSNILNSNQLTNIQDDCNKRPFEESKIEKSESIETPTNIFKRIKLLPSTNSTTNSIAIPLTSMIQLNPIIPAISTKNLATNLKLNSIAIPITSIIRLNSIAPTSPQVPTSTKDLDNRNLFNKPQLQKQISSKQKQNLLPKRQTAKRTIPEKDDTESLVNRIDKMESELNFLKQHIKKLEIKQCAHECSLKILEKQFINCQNNLSDDQLRLYRDSTELNSLMKEQFNKIEKSRFDLNKECNILRNNLKSSNKNLYATRRINCVNGIISKDCTDYADKLIEKDQEKILKSLKQIEFLECSISNQSNSSNDLVLNNSSMCNELIVSNSDSLSICSQISSSNGIVKNYVNDYKTMSLEEAYKMKKEFKKLVVQLKKITICPICNCNLDGKIHQCNQLI